MNINNTRFSRNRGFAMGLFLVVLLVMTTAVVMLLNATASQSKSAAQLTEMTKARLVGLGALDHFYARLQSGENFLANGKKFDIMPISALSGNEPWHKIDKGVITPCSSSTSNPDLFQACYYLVYKEVISNAGLANVPNGLEVTATVRYDCRGDANLCRTITFEQRLRAWQFSDFLFYTQYNVVAPSLKPVFGSRLTTNTNGIDPCARPALERISRYTEEECPGIAYTNLDRITGPVYSADDFIWVCGDPANIFTNGLSAQRVFARGTKGEVVRSASKRGDTGCANFSGSYGTAISSVLRLPAGKVTFEQANAKAISSASAVQGSSVSIKFTAAGAEVSGSTNGVTFISTSASGSIISVDAGSINNEVRVQGIVNGKVSLFVNGKVVITNDLTYNDGVGQSADDVLGINATGDILITPKSPLSTPCGSGIPDPVRKVHALLVSFNGTVMTEKLNQNKTVLPNGCPAALSLFGSLATRYQGVFALYDSATGLIVQGMKKDFIHDIRSQGNSSYLPPYLITPVGQQWVRVDISEVSQ